MTDLSSLDIPTRLRAGFFVRDPADRNGPGFLRAFLNLLTYCLHEAEEGKGPHRCGPFCVWLPDLDSNQFHF